MILKNNMEEQLVNELYLQNSHISAKELSLKLHVSTKTIYRLVQKINRQFKTNDKLIYSEKGKGLKINYELYISLGKYTRSLNSFSPQNRRKEIMKKLLLISPKKENLWKLFGSYYVSESVISKDEKYISKILRQYNLELKRQNRTLAILGSEKDVRIALLCLIQELDVINLDDLKKDTKNFKKEETEFILHEISRIEHELQSDIPYPYNINIFSHLYILLNRAKSMEASYKEIEKNTIKETLSQTEDTSQLYQVARNTVKSIERFIKKKIPEIEIHYLQYYLSASRIQGKIKLSTTYTNEVIEITKLYFEDVSKVLTIRNIEETDYIDLANHIRPMLNRLKHNIKIKNSLLDQICSTYSDIYILIQQASVNVSKLYNLPKISIDEIGFITLYFAKIIETNPTPLKTLIMCMTGLGTSELLRVKVKRKFPDLEIIDVTTINNLEDKLKENSKIDLILTTVVLPTTISVPTLIVSALLTQEDQFRIQSKIEEIRHG